MQYIVFLITFFLVACSSGSGGGGGNQDTLPPPGYNVGASAFSESSISMRIGDTTQVTVSFVNSTRQPEPSAFGMSESNVVTLNPEICSLNFNETPPSCVTTITAIGIGVTKIWVGFGGYPGELTVTVTN